MKIPERHKNSILSWWMRYQREDGRRTFVSDVGTLFWLGVKPTDIKVDDYGLKKFAQDCLYCIYLGSLSPEFPDIPIGVVTKPAPMFKLKHYDIFFCTDLEKTLVARYGNDGSEYTSGKPETIRLLLEAANKAEPHFPMVPVWQRMLELYDASGLEEAF